MYQALYRKWRPQTFDDVVGQTHITETLKTQVAAGRLSHAYLFTGTRGTGKTTCAKLLARAVNCEHPVNGNPCNQCAACRGIADGSILDVLELDAASNNGVDQVRALRDEAIYSPAAVRKRVYIVDEVHMLSPAAFNALLKIMEEPPEHLMFILATTELHKVPATILSRCQRFSFKRLLPEDIISRLTYVAQQEQIDLTAEGAALLARLADGAMRDALSLLDQCAASGGTVDQSTVLETLGLAGNLKIAHMMNAIRRNDTAAALSVLNELYAAGKDIKSLLGELSALGRDLLILQTAPQGGSALLTGGYDEGTMNALCKNFPAARLVRILTILQESQARLYLSSAPRMEAELCLIRLCDETLDGSTDGLAARIARLEAMLANGVPAAPAPSVPEQAPSPISPSEEVPWEEVPPPWIDEGYPPEPEPAEEPAPVPVSQPSPTPVPDSFWPGVAQLMKKNLNLPAAVYIATPKFVTGTLEGGKLTLWAVDSVAKKVLDNPEVLQLAERTVGEIIHAPVSARVVVGIPKPAEAQTVPFDDLVSDFQQFDSVVTIKE